ncbi:MAG: hypothetical protein WD266_09625 [Balneolales bacterium]
MNGLENKPHRIDKLIRTAVIITMTGMVMVLLFLIAGFQAWSVGIGIFMGMPLMTLGIILYIIAVIRDLKFHRVLESKK